MMPEAEEFQKCHNHLLNVHDINETPPRFDKNVSYNYEKWRATCLRQLDKFTPENLRRKRTKMNDSYKKHNDECIPANPEKRSRGNVSDISMSLAHNPKIEVFFFQLNKLKPHNMCFFFINDGRHSNDGWHSNDDRHDNLFEKVIVILTCNNYSTLRCPCSSRVRIDDNEALLRIQTA
ncbi:unnamed protein product [Nesidiocoris tenuis]|uniref:Uncharacterized protein n=1 Tax=Nesidiocoris tenuis TaxID=355587 RepID=A0A6H5HP22_9HEMI|nr:unnamed protein product [Nesidiocoris tenuis]